MPEITVEHLYKSYGEQHILTDVDFIVENGKKTVILGPSGAGKTTLLRCIAGLEIPEQGRILSDGQDITQKKPSERRIAMIFQNAALFENTKIKDNIGYGLRKLGYSKAECEQMVMQSASMLKISHLLDRYPGQLSGGERQRASIARALVRKPSVLLLDEPFSSLDARLSEELQKEMIRLQSEIGMSMIQVTHDQQEAMNMADRIILMKDGKIVSSGTPESLYTSPPDLFTAKFIGTPAINVIEKDSGLYQRLKACYELGDNVHTIAVRPASFVFEEDENGIAEVIRTVSGYGSYEIHARCLDTYITLISKRPLAAGTRFRIGAEKKDLLCFDEEGMAI